MARGGEEYKEAVIPVIGPGHRLSQGPDGVAQIDLRSPKQVDEIPLARSKQDLDAALLGMVSVPRCFMLYKIMELLLREIWSALTVMKHSARQKLPVLTTKKIIQNAKIISLLTKLNYELQPLST